MQCKQYETFTPDDLSAAIEKFANGKQPFGAKHLIVAISTVARNTHLEDELAILQDEHTDLNIELWGAEQINDVLRERADIVSRFWTRETAETFCTGAPLPGVAVSPPNWIRVADQILLSPLGVDGLDERLADADRLRASDPAAAAAYRQLADTLVDKGFAGHAQVLRHKQLDALADVGDLAAAAALAAQLAATALHEADLHQARQLDHRLYELVRAQVQNTTANAADSTGESAPENGGVSAATARHADLIRAAMTAAAHPLGDSPELITVLRNSPAGLIPPVYQPLLVLLLGELTLADVIITRPISQSPPNLTTRVRRLRTRPQLDSPNWITSALTQLTDARLATADKSVKLRLRLLRACYNAEERTILLTLARQPKLSPPMPSGRHGARSPETRDRAADQGICQAFDLCL